MPPTASQAAAVAAAAAPTVAVRIRGPGHTPSRKALAKRVPRVVGGDAAASPAAAGGNDEDRVGDAADAEAARWCARRVLVRWPRPRLKLRLATSPDSDRRSTPGASCGGRSPLHRPRECVMAGVCWK
ncbi:hypothetical protein GGI05_005777 [Coemansia sp. RSA 2603]|nr:hypothetical protein GGI05_005777 [Coemansia sp. RSA 2603]